MPIFGLRQGSKFGFIKRVPEVETVGWNTIGRGGHEGFEGVFECVAACAESDRMDRAGKQRRILWRVIA